MYIFIGIIFVCFGLFEIINPEKVLEWQDRLRIKGQRTYTNYSRVTTIITGVFLTIGGLALIIVSIIWL